MATVTGPILGSWYHKPDDDGGTDEIVFTFLADGTFLVADKGTHANDPTGDSGLEWGDYTWNAANGAFSFTTPVNTDGEWGLSHSGIHTVKVANDILTATGPEGSMVVGRITSLANSIVGSWYATPEGGGSDQIVFTFLADGTLMVSDKGTQANDPNGDSGIEWGTYTFNPGTGVLQTNVIVNTDGEWGLSHGDGPIEFELSGNTLSAGGGAFVMNRVSGVVADPAPALRLVGDAFANTLSGTIHNDTFTGLGGNDTIQGGDGIDTVLFGSNMNGYQLAAIEDGMMSTGFNGAEGSDSLFNIERLVFADQGLALDVIDGHAGTAARILGSVFGAGYVDTPEYMGIILSYLDAGVSYENLIGAALGLRLGEDSTNHGALVDLMYFNIANVMPPQEDRDLYVYYLDSHMVSIEEFAVLAADSEYNANNINLAVRAEVGIGFI